MEYNGHHIPDEKVIEHAEELGYTKMPSWVWLNDTLAVLSPDHIGERHLTAVTDYLYDKLKGG